jgi:predicted RNA binding protein YcfA (HicA-like mRNA interferase family)
LVAIQTLNMKVETQIENELKQAGYVFYKRGKHSQYKNYALNHVITVSTTTRDENAVRIIRGLIRHGKRLAANHI